MKKFLTKVLGFTAIAIFFIYARPIYLLIGNKYQEQVVSDEVYLAINQSKQKTKYKKIVVGDSVAANLFPPTEENRLVYSMTSCIGTEPFGQYLLIKNYLKAGNQLEKVYWIYSPISFSSNLKGRFAYNYFLKPFYRREYLEDFTPLIRSHVKKIPYYFFSQEPGILTSNWTPNFYTDYTHDFSFLSPVAIEAIKKTKKLAEEFNFELVILPTPIIEEKKQQMQELEMDKSEISENAFEDLFDGYFDKIIYLDSTNFLADKSHLLNPQPLTTKYLTELMD